MRCGNCAEDAFDKSPDITTAVCFLFLYFFKGFSWLYVEKLSPLTRIREHAVLWLNADIVSVWGKMHLESVKEK